MIAGPLANLGIELTVIVPDAGGAAAQRLAGYGTPVVATPLHRLRATRRVGPHAEFVGFLASDVRKLARILRDRRIDLVVQSTLVPPHGALAARLAGIPTVWQVVDTRPPPAVIAGSMVIVRLLADAVMFCGRELRRQYETRPLDMPVEVFYPPVDTLTFFPSPERRVQARRELGIPAEARVVGMIGNLNPQKGWEYFVRAAHWVYRDHPDAWFVVLGARDPTHQKYLARLETEMAETGIPRERFVFTGERADVERLLPAFDVKTITSVPRSEGAPTAGLEALACGVPIVGVRVAAIPEFVEDGITGIVVPPLDPGAIARGVSRLLSDHELRARMSGLARARAQERYGAVANAELHAATFARAERHHAARRGMRHSTPWNRGAGR